MVVFDDQPGNILYTVYLEPANGTPLQAESFRMENGKCLTEVPYQQEGLVTMPEGLRVEVRK